MNTEQIKHCLDQVIRFAEMLRSGDNSRPIYEVIGQLGFNLGRWVELAGADGRFHWGLYSAALKTGYYDVLINTATNLRAEI